ncbi:alpha/beta fold hydrolase [Streptomyces sp. NPDC017993]|uniref:alpha/beta fold hydrolase n=1 Tax=Streptomyces sp. NPDC017993 TaxID=3365027 RepID=UPI00379BB2F8
MTHIPATGAASSPAPASAAASPDMANSATPVLPRLSTAVTGDARGPGILLAHGATGSIEGNYAQLIPALTASGHRVVAPDYPGSGRTPRATAPLTLDSLADALVAEADAAGLQTFTLVGFSLGTAVSVRAAVRHPDRVRGLVLTSALARPDRRLGVWLALWLRLLAEGDYAGFAQVRALSGLSPEYLNGLSPAELEAVLDPSPDLPPPGSAEQAALVRTVDTTADLPQLAVPALVIATTRDQLLHPSLSRYVADHIPGATYAEIATGHVPMVERPDEWLGLITDFLAAHRL